MAATQQLTLTVSVSADHVKNAKQDGTGLESDGDSGTWSCDLEEQCTKECLDDLEVEVSLQTDIPLPPPPPPLPKYITVPLAPPPPPLPPRSAVVPAAVPLPPPPPPLLASVPATPQPLTECWICYNTVQQCLTLDCCNCTMCRSCTDEMIATNINEGRAYIHCPNPECTKGLKRDFIMQHLDAGMKNKYERFRLNYEADNTKKTCPNCCYITEKDLPPFIPTKKQKLTPNEYHIICKECAFDWCFNCHSPWHENISCNENKKGDKRFYEWTKSRQTGFIPNCQKCPKCKVYIQRSEGCDYMTCNQCNSHFCYKCGGYFRDFPGLGYHYDRYSVLGCPYNYSPNNPLKRRAVRGTNLCGKVTTLTPFLGYPGLVIGGVAVVVVVVAVALPIVGGAVGTYKLYKYVKRSRNKRRTPRLYRH